MLKKIKKSEKNFYKNRETTAWYQTPKNGVCGLTFIQIPKNGLQYTRNTDVSHTYWNAQRVFWATRHKTHRSAAFKAHGVLIVVAVVTWQQWENGPDAIAPPRTWLANVIAVFLQAKSHESRQRATIYICALFFCFLPLLTLLALFTSSCSLFTFTLLFFYFVIIIIYTHNNSILFRLCVRTHIRTHVARTRLFVGTKKEMQRVYCISWGV